MAKFASITNSAVTIAGTSGTWATGVVSGNVLGWAGTLNIQKIDATTRSSNGWRENLDGTKSFRGTFRMAADDTTVLKTTGGGPTVTLNLYSNTRKISGTFRLSEMAIDGVDHGPEAALPTVTFGIESSGTVTIA
jgi:hypothetical protein